MQERKSIRLRAAALAVVVICVFPASASAAALDNTSVLNVLSSILQTFSRMLANMPQQSAPVSESVAAGGNYAAPFAAAQRVDNLSNVTVRGVTGLTASDIPSLSYLPLSGGTVTGNLTVSGAFSGGTLSLSVASTTNLLATNATTTNFFSTNASTTNATSTTLFSVLGHFTTGIIDTLTATAATITNLIVTTITGTNATFINATTTNATTTNLAVTGTSYFAGSVGIGTTTPWGKLSIATTNNASVPQFVVASSSAISLLVAANGNVGIGTSSPSATLEVNGTGKFGAGGISIPALNSGSSILTVTPQEVGANTYSASVYGGAGGQFGSRLNQVWQQGWNINAINSLPTDTTQSSLAMNFESYFNPDSTHKYMEWYIQYYPPNSVVNQRPFSVGINSINGQISESQQFDTLGWLNNAGTSVGGMSNISGPLMFLKATGSFPAVLQLNNIDDSNHQWNFRIPSTAGSASRAGNLEIGGSDGNPTLTLVQNGAVAVGHGNFAPSGTPTLDVKDNTSSTGVTLLQVRAGAGQGANPIATFAGNVGIATTTPWRTLSVTGTVGFDGLTANFGAGSLCLTANKEVVYNSGSDSCLSSLRSTKHEINLLEIDAFSQLAALHPVSFIYNNDASSTVRYGFIAEDAAAVDPHLATYGADGSISGVDDRGLLAVLVSAVQGLMSRVSNFADSFATQELTFTRATGDEIDVRKLCIGSTCVTEGQLQALLNQVGQQPSPPSAPAPSEGSDASSTLEVIDARSIQPEEMVATSTNSQE